MNGLIHRSDILLVYVPQSMYIMLPYKQYCLAYYRFIKTYFSIILLPLHVALIPDHLPEASHVLIEDPDSLYPWLHLYLTVPPEVNTLPVLLPLNGVPGSPQSIIVLV